MNEGGGAETGKTRAEPTLVPEKVTWHNEEELAAQA